jgi:hypothetical protein
MPRTPGQRRRRKDHRLQKRENELEEREQRAANQPNVSSRSDPYWLGLTQEAITGALDGLSLDPRACFKDASKASALDGGVSLGSHRVKRPGEPPGAPLIAPLPPPPPAPLSAQEWARWCAKGTGRPA